MNDLTAALIAEKNKLYSTVPFIHLLLVEIDDSTTWRLAVYPEDVVFDGDTYTAFCCTIEAVKDSAQGRLETLSVNVANVNRTVSAYLENNSILGHDVTVRVVHAGSLTDGNSKLDNTYRVNRVTVTQDVATFELGHENLMRMQLPAQRYIRGRCRHVYKDDYCAYPSDEFRKTTKQTFKDARTTGSPFTKLHGWKVLNAHECLYFQSAGTTSAEYLTCANNTGAVKEWYNANTDTAYAYKEISGDFEVYTMLQEAAFTENGLWAYWLIQSNTVNGDWIAMAWTRTSGTNAVLVLSTTGGTTTQLATSANWWVYARLVRAGDTWTYYYRLSPSYDWTQLHSFTRAMGDPVRIGFTVCSRDAATATRYVDWDYLRFTSGGLATCDYTLDGPNGCREHCNTAHYGGFPALPSGRINV